MQGSCQRGVKQAKGHSKEKPRSLSGLVFLTAASFSRNSLLKLNQNMDTANPAVFVNAELLHFYVGKRVRVVMQVVRSDSVAVIGKSADEKQLVVKGSPPPAPLTNFVEVIGIVNGDKSIRAEIWTNFGDAIDMFSYHKLGQLANGEFKHLFL